MWQVLLKLYHYSALSFLLIIAVKLPGFTCCMLKTKSCLTLQKMVCTHINAKVTRSDKGTE